MVRVTIVKKLVSYDVISNPKTDADGNAIPDSKGNYIWIVDTVYNYKYTIRVTKLYQESNQTQTESTQNENKNNAQDVDYEEVKE